ncbi:MAG TPA: HEAT repeat domain-containing protein [Candidatus Acidoferrum sp.]|nr:HEAT repeat domain-containing protein [Candidatus Acidoferrum sp.]
MSLNHPPRFAASLLFAVFLAASSASLSFAITGQQKAWAMFESAAKSKNASQRAIGIRALGLLHDNARARKLAEDALGDDNPPVRAAAATALGQMHATESIAKLQKLLTDARISVVMAAAHSLRDLKDDASAYSIYYDVLTGERKGDGLITQQMDTLHNPKELAMIGLGQGIGYVPFAGIGWDAWRYTHKKDPHPVRAVAATLLAHDPDPKTGIALVKSALNDKDWIVRAAALEAIAQRGDPSLEEKIEISLYDVNSHVRYTAAATVIRLTALERKALRKETEKKTAMTQSSSAAAVSPLAK